MTKFLSNLSTLLLLATIFPVQAEIVVQQPTKPVPKEAMVHKLNLARQGAPKLVGPVDISTFDSPFVSEAIFPMPEFTQSSVTRVPVAQVPIPDSDNDVKLYVVKIFDPAWASGVRDFGLFSITPGSTSLTAVASGQHFYGREIAVEANNYFYAAVPLTNGAAYYYRTELDTYEASGPQYLTSPPTSVSTVHDQSADIIYGCFYNSTKDGYILATYDRDSGNTTEIAPVDAPFMAMGIDYAGQLYGIDDKGNFGTIDKTTGVLTTVAATGLACENKTSGCLDKRTGIFYYIVFHIDNGAYKSDLYSIEAKTGQHRFISSIDGGSELAGMWIPRPPFASTVPAAATDLIADFVEYDTDGYVKFTLPGKLYDGDSPASDATLSYEVTFNGESIVSGSGQYGEKIEEYVNTKTNAKLEPDAGYTIAVKVSNAAGSGPEVSTYKFIGTDEVSSISNARLEVTDTEFVITWNLPVGIHGGYVDYESRAAYDIYQYPGGKLVKGDIRGDVSEWRVPITDQTATGSYYFGIAPWVPSPGTNAYRDEVFTNEAVYGHYDLPFSHTFSSADANTCIVVDANKDGVTWVFGNGYATCSYNAGLDMDDWIISLPIYIPADTPCAFTAEVGCNGYSEQIEVYMGKSPKVEDMTRRIVGTTPVLDNKMVIQSNFYETEGGVYFIGFHGCSVKDQHNLSIFNFSIEASGSADAPGEVSDVVISRNRQDFTITAGLRFKAPTTTAKGDKLESISKIDVTLNGDILHTFSSNITPGQELSMDDIKVPALGTQKFGFLATNGEGTGVLHTVSAYIGWANPKTSSWMTATPGETDNEIIVEYEPITTDVNGDDIPTSTLWYQPMVVYDTGRQRTAGNGIYQTTRFVHNPVLRDAEEDPDRQQFVRYYMSAYYYDKPGLWQGNSHASSHVFSGYCPVGPSYTLPYRESFPNGNSSGIFEHLAYGTTGAWGIDSKSANPSASPYDGDGGMVYFVPQAIGDAASLYSGIINLQNTVRPEFTFYYFAVPGSKDMVGIEIDAGGTITTEGSVELGKTNSSGWTKATIDLARYAGKKIRYKLTAMCVSGSSCILVDNIEIRETADSNLAVSSITGPAKASVGDEITVNVTVANTGINPMPAYALTLTADGKTVATVTGSALEPGATESHPFSLTAAVTHGETITFSATLTVAGDQNDYDDTSDDFVTIIVRPTYPAVSDLQASAGAVDGTVELAWSQPSLDIIEGVTVTDDVEDYPRFSIGLPGSSIADDSIGEWSVIDADENPTYKLQNVTFPNNENNTRTMAWMVFGYEGSNITPGYKEDYQSLSGEQCFLCPAAKPYGGIGNDDWLISPALSGAAQTVTLSARAALDGYGKETYEILYSKTGKEINDFVKLGETRSVEAKWYQDRFDLPEGARYFAIRCTSYDIVALMVDDITYEKDAAGGATLELTGYNVYRNLEQVNATPVATASYTDTPDERGREHTYHVTALYTVGESDLSNAATLHVTTGIEAVSADGSISIRVADHSIIVKGAAGLTIGVHTPDGKTLADMKADTITEIPVPSGIYIVNVGSTATKVIVN